MANQAYRTKSDGDSCCGGVGDSSERCATKICPSCGKSECFCRPRFFPGQLLTEGDLNHLNKYILEKNKLHNRQLHGWGVVNGLEVTCHPCDNEYVKVSSGYALDPCGDDIVVADEDKVNICELIKKCKTKAKNDECQPYGYDPECEQIEKWLLTIRYEEYPHRPIHNIRRNQTPECEASVTCEAYRYEVVRAPIPEDPGSDDDGFEFSGAMVERMEACFQAFEEAFPTPVVEETREITGTALVPAGSTSITLDSVTGIAPGQLLEIGYVAIYGDWMEVQSVAGNTVTFSPALQNSYATESFPTVRLVNKQARATWCCKTKQNMRVFFKESVNHNCAYPKAIDDIPCPDPNASAEDFFTVWLDMAEAFLELAITNLLNCVCSSLLPPQPEQPVDLRVPLALIEFSPAECRVVKVCNWTIHRKFVTTFPNLQYWLSPICFTRFLRKIFQAMCCEPLEALFTVKRQAKSSNRFLKLMTAAITQPALGMQMYMNRQVMEQTKKMVKEIGGVSVSRFNMLHSLNQLSEPLATEFFGELDIPPDLLGKVVPPILGRFAGMILPSMEPATEHAELESKVNDLQKRLDAQQQLIEKLMQRS